MSTYTFLPNSMELQQKLWEKIDFNPKNRKKTIKNVGVKGLKFKNLKFRLLEALNNCLLDIHVQFNWSLTKTEQVDRFFHQILPNFAVKRIKIEKFKIPASRGPAECPDTHSCQISLCCDKNEGGDKFLTKSKHLDKFGRKRVKIQNSGF